MERKIEPKKFYYHFKGYIMRVMNIAVHTETNEELVIYRHVTDNNIWARPISMFTEYLPQHNKYRFEEMEEIDPISVFTNKELEYIGKIITNSKSDEPYCIFVKNILRRSSTDEKFVIYTIDYSGDKVCHLEDFKEMIKEMIDKGETI